MKTSVAPWRIVSGTLASVTMVVGGLGCDQEPTSPPGEGPTVTLTVRALTDRSIGLVQAKWTSQETGEEVRQLVRADGVVELTLPVASGPGELTIDGVAPRQFHPFWYPVSAEDLGQLESKPLVLIPRQWRIERGSYAGTVVETSLDPVVEDEVDQTFFTYFFGQPHPRSAPDTYRIDLMAWPIDAVPARVAFDHNHGISPVPIEDSLAIWHALNRVEDVFGIDLFRPAEADSTWWAEPPFPDPGYQPGVIRLIYDRETWRGLPLGQDSLPILEADLGTHAGGGRFSQFQVNRQLLNGGMLRVGALAPLQLADGLIPWETVLAHEALHVLGVGHTFRIASTQGPRRRTLDPSPHDVAYMELLRTLLALEREEATFPALIPAIAGERKLILGLPALPTLQ